MSVQALAWALSVPTGSISRKSVLLGLANCHNAHTGLCCPKVATLARELDCSDSTVRRAIFALEEEGLISVRETRRKDGSQGPNHYILNIPGQAVNVHEQTVTLTGGQTVTLTGQEPETDLEPSEETYVSSADAGDFSQKTPLDLLWDSVDEYVMRAPSAASPRKAYAKLVREMFATGWTPELVRVRARAYRREFPTLILSVAALAKWGEELDRGKRSLAKGGAVSHGANGPAVHVNVPPSASELLPQAENARRMRELGSRLGVLVQGEGDRTNGADHGDDGAALSSSTSTLPLPTARAQTGEPGLSAGPGSPVPPKDGEDG